MSDAWSPDDDRLMIRALSFIKAVTDDILVGRYDIEMGVRFLDVLMRQAFRGSVEVDSFFETLSGNCHVTSMTIDPFIPEDVDFGFLLEMFAKLGLAIGSLPNLKHLKITLIGTPEETLSAVSRILQSVRQIQTLQWSVAYDFQVSENMMEAFEETSAALVGNREIQCVTLDYNRRYWALAGLCRACSVLPCLREVVLDGRFEEESGLSSRQALEVQALIGLDSLRVLQLLNLRCDSVEAASTVCTAIQLSKISELTIDGGIYIQSTTSFLANTLRNNYLQVVELSQLSFDGFESSATLCDAIKASSIASLNLFETTVHEEKYDDLARAVCSSEVTQFTLSSCKPGCEAIFLVSFGASLAKKACFETLLFRFSINQDCEEACELLLRGLHFCKNLVSLELPRPKAWTTLLDDATATCLPHLHHLKELTIDLSMAIYQRHRRPTVDSPVFRSPALQAVAKKHRAIESLDFLPSCYWCPHLRRECNAIGLKNKEIRESRYLMRQVLEEKKERFRRACLGMALHRLHDKPHLMYIWLTAFKHDLMI
jgi:hypothetical protein